MPSPFPGMDPYLEDPARWPGVHQSFITYTRDAMQPALRPRYHALIGERIYLIEPPQSMYPDMIFVRRPVPSEPWGEGGVAAAEVDAPVLVEILPQEIREVFIEIVHTASTEVITIIEVLSPSNKMSGEGRDLYLRKQQQILSSQVHLVEIDLLRSGSHTLAAPQHGLAELAEPWHYLVSVRRVPRRYRFELYPAWLRRRLPRIAVPLLAPDPDIALDLQAVFVRCYENGGYEDFIDYRREPPVSLPPDDATWADALLREQGRREGSSS